MTPFLSWVADAGVRPNTPGGSGLFPTPEFFPCAVGWFGGIMSDNKSKRSGPDRSRINLHEDYEVRYWSKKFGITKHELEKAVKKAGSNSVKRVELELAGSHG
jgi:hypothetical protein